jgi:hypothetical protein
VVAVAVARRDPVAVGDEVGHRGDEDGARGAERRLAGLVCVRCPPRWAPRWRPETSWSCWPSRLHVAEQARGREVPLDHVGPTWRRCGNDTGPGGTRTARGDRAAPRRRTPNGPGRTSPT